jgi:hypothetical protein
MAVVRVQHAFQDTTGLPQDQYVNVFHFIVADDDFSDAATVATAIENFYKQVPSGASSAIDDFLGSQSDAPNATIKMYNLSEDRPRTPFFTRPYNPPAHAGSLANLPNEVAICLSYAAPGISGQPPARRRGRIYLGPLNVTAMATVASGLPAVPIADLQIAATKAFANLHGVADAVGWQLAVFSPTAQLAAEVSTCWMDNAFDTQRRRGTRATARVTEPIA